ncbi:uncharacterized protein Nmag_0249 [Natrialba magadii ATCC 43099]|uniref:Uncharacterized protein n=1 Tax=Natrialba magadii (strain ATCC 43099 / DSM 3394 / CCM 3739 / CIP 104546 / IAM 13178 / JCM 8861 / NBRC 102185 / NCIMB 2190 / MS3) TaxID=547559 RepID=D3SX21_NATMM|nr:hypothetical protein [Natrialba magadii]ADD03841.1 uncharacterized protein Nmag_0249 [Natrialba magadii ATCC 43099]ELY33501.1 hypothetical protein C500_01675 [Natrialba magadii ATCC 43099]
MPEEATDERLDQFLRLVEEETGEEPLPDPYIGDICWFMIHYPIEFQGETFTAEFDMNLSEDDVTPQWGEILIDIPDEEQEAILDAEADKIEYSEGDEALYEFPASEDQIPELMEDLRKVHAEVYG